MLESNLTDTWFVAARTLRPTPSPYGPVLRNESIKHHRGMFCERSSAIAMAPLYSGPSHMPYLAPALVVFFHAHATVSGILSALGLMP